MLFGGRKPEKRGPSFKLSPPPQAPKRPLTENNGELGSGNLTRLKCVSGQNQGTIDLFSLDDDELYAMAEPPLPPALPTVLPYMDLVVETFVKNRNGVRVMCHKLHDEFEDVRLTLQGFWADTPLRRDMRIRVFAPDSQRDPVVDDCNNFLVICPDTLVMCTSIASSTYCQRKVALSERFRGGCDPGNKIMLAGTIVHCLFQSAVRLNPDDVTERWLERQLGRLALENVSVLEQLAGLNWKPEEFRQEARRFYPHIQNWCRKYLGAKPAPVFPTDPNSTVTGIRDIEENIWCTRFGLRGKVDLSLEIGSERQKVAPLELKTGKSSMGADHQGQVLLYTLMISSVLKPSDAIIRDGLLMYVKDGSTHPVKSSHNSIRGLLQLRNQMAYFLAHLMEKDGRPFALPEPIDDERFCSNCEHLLSCALWQRTFEGDRNFMKNETMRKLVPALLQHLHDKHVLFFAKMVTKALSGWEKAKTDRSANSDAWNVAADVRELTGNCIAAVRMCKVIPVGRGSDSFSVTFTKNNESDFPSTNFGIGALVMISSETRQHTNIFMGPVTSMTAKEITVTVDRRPQKGIRDDTFRLDTYCNFNTFQLDLVNVTRLMANSDPCARLRSVVIDCSAAEFEEKLPSSQLRLIKPLLRGLSQPQLRAIVKCLMVNDYLLAQSDISQGCLSATVRSLLAVGRSVLVTSYSNAILDELLIQILNDSSFDQSKLLRIGSARKNVDKELAGCYLEAKLTAMGEPELLFDALCNIYDTVPLVACTVQTAANHLLFSRRRFDYAFVVHAEKSGVSATLGPLLAADRFVLVRDGSKESVDRDKNSSLFDFLKSCHPTSIVNL